jgi:outer membrane protein
MKSYFSLPQTLGCKVKQRPYKIYLLFFFALLTFSGQAQNTNLTLTQVLEKALQNNINIATAELDREIAASKVREVYTNLLPKIDFSGQYQYMLQIPVQIFPGEILSRPGEQIPVQFGVPQTISATFSASQIIYNPSVFLATKAAKAGANLTALQVKEAKENVIYSVSATYYNLQTVAKQAEFVQANMASIDKLLTMTELLQKGGMAKQLDVDRLKVNKQNLQTSYQNLQVAEKQLLNALKLQLNLPQTEEISIDKTIAETETAINSQIGLRTDLLLLEQNFTLLNLQKESIKVGYLPTLAAFASWGHSAFNDTFNPFQKNAGTSWYPTTFVGLQLNVPIFDGMRKYHEVKTKNFELEKLQKQRQLLTQNIEMQTSNANNQYAQSKVSLASQRENLALAQKNYENLQLQYKAGILPISEIISAENSLKEAQTNFLTELVKLRMAELELKKVTGNLITN